jgi:putative salt-induced outer membrane protein YdiY
MSKERYNQIIDEVYMSYLKKHFRGRKHKMEFMSKDSFINKIKTDQDFSDKFGLKIKEDYDLVPQTECWGDVTICTPVRRYKTYVVYKAELFHFYE